MYFFSKGKECVNAFLVQKHMRILALLFLKSRVLQNQCNALFQLSADGMRSSIVDFY